MPDSCSRLGNASRGLRALQDGYYKTSGSFESSGIRIHSLVAEEAGPSLDSKQQSGSMQEEDCMQGTSAQEEKLSTTTGMWDWTRSSLGGQIC